MSVMSVTRVARVGRARRAVVAVGAVRVEDRLQRLVPRHAHRPCRVRSRSISRSGAPAGEVERRRRRAPAASSEPGAIAIALVRSSWQPPHTRASPGRPWIHTGSDAMSPPGRLRCHRQAVLVDELQAHRRVGRDERLERAVGVDVGFAEARLPVELGQAEMSGKPSSDEKPSEMRTFLTRSRPSGSGTSSSRRR